MGTPWVAQHWHGNHAIWKGRVAASRSQALPPLRLALDTNQDITVIQEFVVSSQSPHCLSHRTPASPAICSGTSTVSYHQVHSGKSLITSAAVLGTPTSLVKDYGIPQWVSGPWDLRQHLPQEPGNQVHSQIVCMTRWGKEWHHQKICEKTPLTNRTITFKTQLH